MSIRSKSKLTFDDNKIWVDDVKLLKARNERLVKALQELVDAATAEVNEKGAGGYLLARLTDAKAVLEEGKPKTSLAHPDYLKTTNT